MYNKVTNKPTAQPFYEPNLIPELNNNTRAFSFADPIQQNKSSTESINDFIQKFMMLQQATNISRTLPGLLMMNCDDINNLNELISDSNTQKHVKDRINKYIKITQYVSIGCPEIKNQQKYQRTSQQQSYEIATNKQAQNILKMTNKNDINKYKVLVNEDYGVHRSFKQDTVSSKKNLVTSRYLNNKQDQINYNTRPSDVNSRVKSIKQLNKVPSNHNRSGSSSRASNSKSFNKIQLKSVSKIKPKQSGTFNKTMENQERKQQKNKKYTISRRVQSNKHEKALSNQVSYIKNSSNNSLIVSRMKSNQLNKSGLNQHCKVSPNNRHRLVEESLPTEQSRLKCQNEMNREVSRELGLGQNKTQITKQTVQKSTQFINMLRMMSEE